MDLISRLGLTIDPLDNVLRLGNEECILNQRSIESKPVRLTACQNVKVKGNAETIVRVRAEIELGFAIGIIQQPHTSKKNLMIASALINIDNGTSILVANIFPKPMYLHQDWGGSYEPVTKIVHHNDGLSDNTDEEKNINLEIPALELGHLTDNKRDVAGEFLQKHSGMFASGESSGSTNIVLRRINTRRGRETCTENAG